MGFNTGLGDYIHWRFENYLNYGYYQTWSKKKSQSAETVALQHYKYFKDKAKKNAAQVSESNRKMLENIANAFTNQDIEKLSSDFGLSQSDIDSTTDNLKTAIEQRIGKAGELDINSMDFYANTRLADILNMKYSGMKKSGSAQVRMSTIDKLADNTKKNAIRLLQQYRAAFQKNVCSADELNKLLENAKALKKLYDSLQREVKNLKTSDTSKLISYRGTSLENIFKDLAKIDRALRRVNSNDESIVAELAFSAILSLSSKLGVVTTEDIIKTNIGSDISQHGEYSRIRVSGKFTDKTSLQLEDEVWSGELSNNKVIHLKAHGKKNPLVDVTLDFGKEASSVKAYNLEALKRVGAGVTIADKVPLETMLSSTMRADFGNHYLNLLAANTFSSERVQKVKKMTSVLGIGLAARGLLGIRDYAHSSNPKAKYFVLFNKANNKWMIFSTKALLDALGPSAYNFNYDAVYGFDTSLNRIRLNNTWSTTAKQRITSIINECRKFKLSMSLKPGFLETFNRTI